VLDKTTYLFLEDRRSNTYPLETVVKPGKKVGVREGALSDLYCI
jgi:hypothetical protein